jgi:hypothetical protein
VIIIVPINKVNSSGKRKRSTQLIEKGITVYDSGTNQSMAKEREGRSKVRGEEVEHEKIKMEIN